jgi:hypothetical protein
MKINVTKAVQVWKSSDGSRKIWELEVPGGESYQTMSEKIAGGGEFEVEVYDKNGRKFVRQAKAFEPNRNKYEADPNKISSIEWQKAIAEGRQAVKDYYEIALVLLPQEEAKITTLEEYKKLIVNTAITFASAIGQKPDHLLPIQEDEVVLEDDTKVEDLPPVELYDAI